MYFDVLDMLWFLNFIEYNNVFVLLLLLFVKYIFTYYIILQYST